MEFDIIILVCNRCFETWLLGCKGLYPKETVERDSFFYPYYNHYNIEECNPEAMLAPEMVDEITAKYHFHYLHELLRYKKIRYSKSNPKNIATSEYFNGIVERINSTKDLQTFKEFYDFIFSVKL